MSGREAHRRGRSEHPAIKLDQVTDVLRENQKLITLGRLAASIAHEINNPLESITNLLYLMEQDAKGKNAEYLKLAQRELGRVVQISKQTLTFSRETSMPARVHLSELIEEVLGLHGRRIKDHNLRVVRQYETYEQITVLPGEMRQVMLNLVSNAIEATPTGGRIVIRIRAGRRWSGHGARGLRLSIGDNGSGITEEVRERLGEPFFTTKGQSGTGLGLWLTESILSRYGGTLQLRSSVSPRRHGTVFSIFLPLNLRTLAAPPGGRDTAENTPATGTRGRRWSGLRLIPQVQPRAAQTDSMKRGNGNPSADMDSSESIPVAQNPKTARSA
ncbi:MAG: two-component system sensor histidine kinase NtrB [Acidobacteriaceae bacterium]